MKVLLPFTLLATLCYAELSDWLTANIEINTTLEVMPSGHLMLSNGIISREFALQPGFSTVDIYCHYKNQSILRTTNAEASITLDYIPYAIGGFINKGQKAYINRTEFESSTKHDPHSFQYISHTTFEPKAPYPYVPARGIEEKVVWPQVGIHLSIEFQAPATALPEHKDVKVFIHYEMYDGLPVMIKWLEVRTAPQVEVGVEYVERVGVNNQWG